MPGPIKFFMDEHVPASVTKELLRLGIDVLTVQAARMRGRGDPELLAFAASEGRICVTQNTRDFLPLHQAGVPHAGIIIVSNDVTMSMYVNALTFVTQASTPEDWVNHLESLKSLVLSD